MTATAKTALRTSQPASEASDGVDGELVFLVSFVSRSRRAQEILRELREFGRKPTKYLLKAALGRVSRKDYDLLVQLSALGLVKRYPGHDEDNHYVVWNELTELGRRVLEIVERMNGNLG